ncbi:MAG: tetratricopeptide repeat protein [Pirellulales bacterium]|nr:tetratricopeptide repeat protein [Pirellulales bacterium]
MWNLRRSLFAVVTVALAIVAQAARAEPADDQYAVAAGHYAQGRWQLAVDEFSRFLKDFAGHSRQAQAQFYLAEALVQLERYDEARTSFKALLANHPEHRSAAQARFRSAEAAYLGRHTDEARDEFAAFVELHPGDKLAGNACWYLGTLALDSGDATAAERWFRKGLEKTGEGRTRIELRIGLARALEQSNQQDAAAKVLQDLIGESERPHADEARLLLARLQFRSEKPADALTTLEPLEEADAANHLKHQARLLRGCCQFRLGNVDEAKKILGPLFESEHVGIEARYWSGVIQQSAEQWSDAAQTFRAAAERAPYHVLAPALHVHAGEALLAGGDPAGAVEQFKIVLDRWADGAWADDASAGCVRAAEAREDHPAVVKYGEEFAQHWPASEHLPDVQARRVRSLLALDRAADAVALLATSCAEPETKSPRVADQLLYAAALDRAGRHADALAAADRLLDQITAEQDNPETPSAEHELASNLRGEALATRARALAGLERWDDAIAAFSRYLEVLPDGPRAVFCRGERAVCLAKRGEWDAARQEYRSYQPVATKDRASANSVTERLAVLAAAGDQEAWSSELFAQLADKDNPDEVAARGLWGQARNAYRASRWQEAEQLFARFLARFENHTSAAEALLLRGTALDKLKDDDGAAEAFRELAKRFPASDQASTGLLAAARLATRKQRKEEADALYKRVVDEHPDDPHADVALFEWNWVLRDLGRADEADKRLAKLRERFPTSVYADDATYRLAERAYRAADYERAEELTRLLLADRPTDAATPQLAEKLAPYVWYLAGQVAAAQERWPDVVARMQHVGACHPPSTLALLAEFWGAEALFRQNDFAAAAKRFAELAPRIDGRRENWVAVVALRRAQSQAQLKNWDAAESLARRIPVDFPQFNQLHEVDYLLGRSLASRGLFQQAREAYRRVIDSTTAGKTETVAMAQWMIGETYFHQQDYADAIREYLRGETLYGFPEWQAAALLQAAKCHEALLQWDEAIKLYEQIGQKYTATTHASEATQRLTDARAQHAKHQAMRAPKPGSRATR